MSSGQSALAACRLGCGWSVYVGPAVMETLEAIHERNRHEAKCRGINPPATIDTPSTLTPPRDSDRMHPTHE